MPRYTEFAEFIAGITNDIWENRQIHFLKECYSDDIKVRSPEGLVVGNRAVIAATMATLAEFPDRQLLEEDVIWDRTGEDSWFSSHRIFSTATHSGPGRYGDATGRHLRYRIIADCHAVANDRYGWSINDEWLIRDQGAIVRQIGYTPKDYVQATLTGELASVSHLIPDAEIRNAPYSGTGNDSEVGLQYESILDRMMRAEFSAIPEEYQRGVQLHLPGGCSGHGWADADAFWLGLRSALPDAAFRIEHRIGRNDPGLPARAAIRWSLEGRHSGGGLFGAPTGRNLYVLGLSHAEFGQAGIRSEYTLFDEVAVWHQLLS